MAITATAGGPSGAGVRLSGRRVTGLGILAATLRLSVEQLFGQAVGDVGRTAGSLASGSEVLHGAVLDGIGGALVGTAMTADRSTSGLLGLVLLLILPIGGPVWAGLVPVGATLAAARTGARWACAGAALGSDRRPGVRVVRNVPWRRGTDDGPMTLRILIVDDSNDFRELARRVLVSDGLEVVGTVATCAEALAAAAGLRPQVALVDVNLGAESGFDVARLLRSSAVPVRPIVVLMSTQPEEDLADAIARSPVAGFVAKQRLSGEAVRAVLGPGAV